MPAAGLARNAVPPSVPMTVPIIPNSRKCPIQLFKGARFQCTPLQMAVRAHASPTFLRAASKGPGYALLEPCEGCDLCGSDCSWRDAENVRPGKFVFEIPAK